MDDRPADPVVLLSILILLLAGDMLSPAPATRMLLDWMRSPGQEAPTAAIGGLVGFAELVSRYRDAPWRAALMPPGIMFVGVNALAALLALVFTALQDYLAVHGQPSVAPVPRHAP